MKAANDLLGSSLPWNSVPHHWEVPPTHFYSSSKSNPTSGARDEFPIKPQRMG